MGPDIAGAQEHPISLRQAYQLFKNKKFERQLRL